MTTAIDFTKPATSDNYSTGFVPNIQNNQSALAQWLDSNLVTYTAGLVAGMKRLNSTSGLFEQYNGSAWVTLTFGYAALAGATFTGAVSLGSTVAQAAPSATAIPGTSAAMFANTGGNGLYVGQYPSGNGYAAWIQSSYVNPTTAVYPLVLQPLGGSVGIGTGGTAPTSALQVNGIVTATSFTGAGTGLTGTGASFTAGTANSLTAANSYIANSFVSSGNAYGISNVYGSGSSWFRSIFYNDGSSMYLLASASQTTQAAANTATFSSIRPFSYNLTSGAVAIDTTGAGTTFGGLITSSALTIAGAGTPVTISSSNSVALKVSLADNGTFRGGIGADSTTCFRAINAAGSTWVLTIDNSGNGIFSGNVTAYSDERIKTNWRDMAPDFIDKLAALKCGIYDRTDIELTQVGVPAQGLREFLPDAVLESDDGRLSVAYGNAAMVACVELAKRVVALEAAL